jgi:hypothetical protein
VKVPAAPTRSYSVFVGTRQVGHVGRCSGTLGLIFFLRPKGMVSPEDCIRFNYLKTVEKRDYRIQSVPGLELQDLGSRAIAIALRTWGHSSKNDQKLRARWCQGSTVYSIENGPGRAERLYTVLTNTVYRAS